MYAIVFERVLIYCKIVLFSWPEGGKLSFVRLCARCDLSIFFGEDADRKRKAVSGTEGESMSTKEKKVRPNAAALLPIALFLILYLGNGIFFEYVAKDEGQMGFYVVSVVLAFSIALISAFLQNRKQSFDEKIHICAQGIGDDNIVIMLFIFIMAGAFSGIAGEAGGASSTANLLLSIIPGRFAVPGLFVIACLISMAMGTSVVSERLLSWRRLPALCRRTETFFFRSVWALSWAARCSAIISLLSRIRQLPQPRHRAWR